MKQDFETLESFLPGLAARLRQLPLEELEKPGNPGLACYRDARGPAVLIPREHGGGGASPLDAVRIHRAAGSLSPSLAIAMTMHNFSVATLVEYCFYGDYTVDLLKQVAEHQLLVSSGFAEGRTGTSILAPLMTAERFDGGYRINGSKKPCSLSRSMDLLTASVAVKTDNGVRRAVAIVPAQVAGIERRPFWKSWVLTGAESDELLLQDVIIPEDHLFFPEVEEGLDAVEAGGFLWFELLVSASYLGVASALVARVIEGGKGDCNERVQAVLEVEGAMAALEGLARAMIERERGEDILVRALLVRFAVQQAIERAGARAAELLGGMSFIRSSEVAYFLAASRALAFHPPSRLSISPSIDGYLRGGQLQLA
jgi:alkylation response protein AidB-like acyl-CoA dehydrogenase